MDMKNNILNQFNFIMPNKNWIEWFIGFLDAKKRYISTNRRLTKTEKKFYIY